MAEYPGFISGDMTSRSLRADSERTINLYLELNEDGFGKSRAALYSTPGLTTVFTLPDSPVYDLWVDPNFGSLYAITGPAATPHLFQIDALGAATNLGIIPSVHVPASANHSQPFIVGSNQVAQLLLGGGRLQGAIYTRGTGLFTTLDSGTTGQGGWPPFISSGAFIDGYFIVNQGAFDGITPQYTNSFSISSLNDGTLWDALDFTQEGDGPDAIVGVTALKRDLWLFGARRTVVYYDSGSADFPFSRVTGGVIDATCIAAGSICAAAGSIFFMGSSGPSDISAENPIGTSVPSTGASVFQTLGYTARRISTHSVEKAIGSWPDLAAAQAFIYEDGGHVFYVLNGASGAAQVYDMTTKSWHERISNLGTAGNYDPQCYARWNGMHLVGSATSGKIYQMATSIYTDNGGAITRTRIGPPLSSENRYSFFHRFTLDLEVGTEASGQQNLTLAWSNDGGQTFPMSKTIVVGGVGQYSARAFWNRLGKGRDRVFQFTTSDPMQIALIAAYLDSTPGVA